MNFNGIFPNAIFSRSSTAYLSDGTMVMANTPRYEVGRFEKGIMIEEGTTNLVFNSDYDVLKPTKERVFFDDFNRTPTLTFTRGSTNSSKTLMMDFNGKVAGSTTENPHAVKTAKHSAFNSPSWGTWAEESNYSQLSTQDGTSSSISHIGTGIYAQQLFSFNILTALKLANLIPQSWDVATLKANLGNVTITWVGYGVGSNANVSENGAKLKHWTGVAWFEIGTNSTSSSSSVQYTSSVYGSSNVIGSDGTMNFLAHSTYASNGTIASAIYTDHIKLDVTVNSPGLARNPEDGAVVEPNAVRYVNGRFQNLLSKNQSDIEVDTSGFIADPNVTISRGTSLSWQESASLNVVRSSGGALNGCLTSEVSVTAGVSYIGSAYVYSTVSESYGIYLVWYDSSGVQISNVNTNITLTASTWTRMSVVGVAPNNAVSVRIKVRPIADGTQTWNVDGFQLETGTTPTEWREGGSGKAILIEEETTNMVSGASQLTGYTVGLSGPTASVPDAGSYIKNGVSRIYFQRTSINADRRLYQNTSMVIDKASNYVYSVDVKVVSGFVEFYARGSAVNNELNTQKRFAKWDGTIVTTYSGATLLKKESIGDGWYRLSILISPTFWNGTDSNATIDHFHGWTELLSYDVYTKRPQFEQKLYATSFVDGTRNTETLTIPTTGISPTAGTWEQWVYVDERIRSKASEGGTVFHIRSSKNTSSIGIWVSLTSTGWRIQTRADDNSSTVSPAHADILSKGWHLFTVIWNSSSAKLFIDGVVTSSIILNPKLPTAFENAYLGFNSGSSFMSNTYHDAIRVSNVVRSDAEILAYYNATSPVSQLDDKTVFLLNFDGDLDAEVTVQNGWNNVRNYGVSGFRIKGNRLYTGDNLGKYFWDAQLTSGDSEWTDIDISCKVKINSYLSSINTPQVGYLIRSNDFANDFLMVSISIYNGGRVYVQKRISGTSVNVTFFNTPITVGAEYTLRTVITGTSGTVYLDGVQIITFTMPTDTPTQGRIGPYSSYAEATFDDLEVKIDVPEKWSSYGYSTITERGYVSFPIVNGSRVFKTTSINSDCGMSQLGITTVPNMQYTLSALVKGNGKAILRDETNGVSFFSSPTFNYPDWTRASWTVTAPVGCTQLRPYFSTNAKNALSTLTALYVDRVQLEQKPYPTSYNRNDSTVASSTRSNETLTIPTTGMSSSQGTIEAWIKLNRQPGTNIQTILDLGGTGVGGVFFHIEAGGRLKFQYWDGTSLKYAQGTTILQVDTIYHVAASWSKDGSSIYVNGNKESAITSIMVPVFHSNAFVGSHDGTQRWLDGVIDSLRVSNITRSDTEILNGYNNGTSLVSDKYTVANYKFDNNLFSHDDIKAILMPNGNFHLRGQIIQS